MDARIRSQLMAVFGLDVRGLALFRVGLGVLVVVDAFTRVLDAEMFYSDIGIAPPPRSLTLTGVLARPSLYWLSGSTAWATALLLITAVAGVALALGWRTRIAALASWALVVSVQHRNGLINTGADQVMACFLFLALFLPIGERFSLDARRRAMNGPPPGRVVLGAASAAFVLQLVLIYLFNVFNKDGDGWFNGQAVLQALHIDHHTTALGVFIRERMAWLSTPLTFGTLLVEGGVLFLFVPNVRVRVALFVAMWGMHIGFAVCMFLGLFSPACMVAWLAVVPPSVWDRVARRFPRFAASAAASPAETREAAWRRAAQAIGGACALGLIALQIGVNVHALDGTSMSRVPTTLARALSVQLAWRMFGDPSRNDGWWVIPGTLADGRVVDLFKDGVSAPVFDKPESVGQTYRTARWRKLMMYTAQEAAGASMRKAHARWYCRNHNATHTGDDALVKLEMVFMEEKTRWDFKPRPPRRLDLLTFPCERPR